MHDCMIAGHHRNAGINGKNIYSRLFYVDQPWSDDIWGYPVAGAKKR